MQKLTDLQIGALEALKMGTLSCGHISTSGVHNGLEEYSDSPLPQLRALEKKGYVESFDDGPGWRKIKYWKVTDEGRTALAAVA